MKIDETMTNLGTVYSVTNDSKAFVRDDSAYGHKMLRWDPSIGQNPPEHPHRLIDSETRGTYLIEEDGSADHLLDEATGKMTKIIPHGASATHKLVA